MSQRTWDSLHVYLHRDHQAIDRFLVDAVAPLMREHAREQRIGPWFYIRYWEGGPHLRVRFRDASPDTASRIAQGLAEQAARLPGVEMPLDAATYYGQIGKPAEAVQQYGWRSDQTVERVPYVPEVARYGGPIGIAISEQFFAASTQAALAAIKLASTR